MLDVALGAGRLAAVHDLLCRASAEHTDDARAQIRLGEVVSIRVGPLVRHAERLPARNDRDSVHWIGAGYDESEDRMPSLVIGDALAILSAHE